MSFSIKRCAQLASKKRNSEDAVSGYNFMVRGNLRCGFCGRPIIGQGAEDSKERIGMGKTNDRQASYGICSECKRDL